MRDFFRFIDASLKLHRTDLNPCAYTASANDVSSALSGKKHAFGKYPLYKLPDSRVIGIMSRQLFVTLDGPKGTGKTTLLESITQVLRADNRKVIRISEQKSDPFRAESMTLVNRLARDPSVDLEREICERFALSRAWISQNVLTKQPENCIILMDRWYPSDAAFRRMVPFAEIVQLNIEHNVRAPDLHVGVVTAPEVSWERAAVRSRGLGSTVIHRLEEHIACTRAFEQEVVSHGWFLCRNEGSIEEATMQIVAEINRML